MWADLWGISAASDLQQHQPELGFHCANSSPLGLGCSVYVETIRVRSPSTAASAYSYVVKFIFPQNSLLGYDNLMSRESLQHEQLENRSHACMPEWNYCRLDSVLIIFFLLQVENEHSACADKSQSSVQSRGWLKVTLSRWHSLDHEMPLFTNRASVYITNPEPGTVNCAQCTPETGQQQRAAMQLPGEGRGEGNAQTATRDTKSNWGDAGNVLIISES